MSTTTSPSMTFSPAQDYSRTDSHNVTDSHNDSHDRTTIDNHATSTNTSITVRNGASDAVLSSLTGLIGNQGASLQRYASDAMRAQSTMVEGLTQMMSSLGSSLFGNLGARAAQLL